MAIGKEQEGPPEPPVDPSDSPGADLLPFPPSTGRTSGGTAAGAGSRSSHPANASEDLPAGRRGARSGAKVAGSSARSRASEGATDGELDEAPERSEAARAARAGRVAAARKHVNDGRPQQKRRRAPATLHPEGRDDVAERAYPVTAMDPDAFEGGDVDPRHDDVDVWGRSEHFRELARRFGGFYYRRWFRVSWEGLEKIPTEGGALLVANHAGALPSDAPMLMHGIEEELGRPVYGMADSFFRTVPVVGTLWSRGGGVMAHPDNAQRLLHDDGQLALVFPEGVKGPSKLARDRYQLRRFGRGGFVETAMRAGVPIVPIAVIGAEESMPVLFKVPAASRVLHLPYFPVTVNHFLLGPVLGTVTWLPAKFTFRVLDPVRFDVPAGRARYPRSRVMDEAEAIRQRLQDTLYEMLAERRSVWFG